MKIEPNFVLSYPTLEQLLEALFMSYDHGNSIFARVK
jgi:hypothetical protein